MKKTNNKGTIADREHFGEIATALSMWSQGVAAPMIDNTLGKGGKNSRGSWVYSKLKKLGYKGKR